MNTMLFPVISEKDKELPFYFVGAGTNWNQDHIVRPEGYPIYQWIQCVKGEGELLVNGKSLKVEEASAILLYPGIPHEYYAIKDEWIVEWVLFAGTQVESFLKQVAGIEGSGVYYVSQPDIFLSRIQTLLSIEQAESTRKSLKWSGIIYQLLTDIAQYTSENPNSSLTLSYKKLRPLFDYIDRNYNQPFTLEAMADLMAVTPQHLCTYFKKVTGMRIFEYINSIRIKKSKELILQNKDLKIKEIAISSGFDDFSYFCSVFKRYEKMSPGQFKDLYNC